MYTKIFFGIDSKLKAEMGNYVTATGEPDALSTEQYNLWNNKKYMNKYDVISFDDAIKKFPKADIYITYAHTPTAIKAAKEIAKTVSYEKIHFLAANIEYRKSCHSIGTTLVYNLHDISTCSIVVIKRPRVKFKGNPSTNERIDMYCNLVTNLIENARYGRPTPCDNCPLFKPGLYPKKPSIKTFCFLQELPKATCNFKCIFCASTLNNKWHKLRDAVGSTTRDVIKELSQMPEFNREDFTIRLANGEPMAGRYANEILDILLASKWKVDIVSNSSIYKEKLVQLMNTGRVTELWTSLDSGTRETFLKIKQVDMFDRVVENLKRLPLHKTLFYLKYIFLEGINDNDIDIDGFYEVAKELKANIIFSANSYEKENRLYTDKMLLLTEKIIKKAKSDGLKVGSHKNHLHPSDQKFISETYKNYNPVP
ncbi:MAG: radical SAM protein [Defluviitaleaceae bacterium]|nr:radical SAM protein [Defluviitaleaceae bacterium]